MKSTEYREIRSTMHRKIDQQIFSLHGYKSDDKRIKDFLGFLVFILASFVDEWVVNNSMQSASVLPSFPTFKML